MHFLLSSFWTWNQKWNARSTKCVILLDCDNNKPLRPGGDPRFLFWSNQRRDHVPAGGHPAAHPARGACVFQYQGHTAAFPLRGWPLNDIPCCCYVFDICIWCEHLLIPPRFGLFFLRSIQGAKKGIHGILLHRKHLKSHDPCCWPCFFVIDYFFDRYPPYFKRALPILV